jgi:hypothetical protein
MNAFYKNIEKKSSPKMECLMPSVCTMGQAGWTWLLIANTLEDDSVVLFSHQSGGDGDFENQFSVGTPGHQQLNSRSIVSYQGVDSGNGLWKCSKDGMHDCAHVRKACNHLQKVITGDPSAMDGNGLDETLAPGTAKLLDIPVLLTTRG